MSSSSCSMPKAFLRRKTQLVSKKQTKKDGHGKFNWGKPTDYEYTRDPTEGDDKRVLDDLLADTSIILVATDGSILLNVAWRPVS